MVGFEKVELDNGVDQEQARSQHPPQGDVPRQGLRDGRPSKLDADEKLCDDDGDHHPALATQFVALGVVQELKGLPQGNLTSHDEAFHPLFQIHQILKDHRKALTAPQSRIKRRRIGLRMWFGGTHRANLAKFNLFQDLDFEKLKNARKLLL